MRSQQKKSSQLECQPRKARHRRFRPFLESLETRVVLDAVSWNIAASGFWDVASNWLDTTTNQNRVPTSGDVVTIDQAGVTVTVRDGESVQSLQATSAVTLANGNLTLAADSEIDGVLTVGSGSTLTTNASLTLTGSDSWTGGSLAGSGSITVTNAGALTLSGAGGQSLNVALSNAGHIAQASGATLSINGVTLTNQSGAVYDLQDDVGMAGSGTFDNAGMLLKSAGTGTSSIQSGFSNRGGTLTSNSGTLDLASSGGTSTGGTFEASQGATLDLTGGNNILTGTYTGSGAGTVLVGSPGGVLFNGLVIGPAGATFNFPAGLFQVSNGSLNLAANTLTNSGSITFTTTVGSNADIFANGGYAGGPGGNNLGGTLLNTGTIVQQSAVTLSLFDGVTIRNAGSYQFTGDGGSIVTNNFAPMLINTSTGTIAKTSGTGTSSIQTGFSNQGGTLAADSGTLDLASNAGTSTGGTFNASQGAILDLTGGNNILTGTYTGSGTGTVLVGNGNSVLFNGVVIGPAGATFNFPTGLLQVSNGSLNLAGNTLTNTGSITFTTTVGSNAGIFANGGYAGGPGGNNLGGTLLNTGTIVQQGAVTLSLFDSVTISNAGSYQFAGDGGSIVTNNFAPMLINTSTGTIAKTSGTLTSSIQTGFSNQGGTLTSNSGTLDLASSGGTSTGGTFEASQGATLDLTGGNNILTGTYTGSGAGTVLVGNNGSVISNGVVIGSAGATFNFPAGLLQVSNGSLNLAGNTLTNSGSIAFTVAVSSNAAVFANGQYAGGPGGINLGGTLVNRGTLIEQDAVTLSLFDSVTISNAGSYQFAGDGGTIVTNNFSPMLVNTSTGTIAKSSGTGTSSIQTGFSNQGGTLASNSGTLNLASNGGVSTSGTFEASQNATLDLSGGNNVLTGTYTGAGAGTLALNSGTLAIGIGGATFQFDGNFFQWTGGFISTSQGDLTNVSTINLAGSSDKLLINDGTLHNQGTIIQTGTGNFALHSDNVTATTFDNELGASYLIESDSGIDNTFGGVVALTNAGTIRKTAGTGNSTLFVNGQLSNTGMMEADSGTLFVDANSVAQISGSTLTAGAWKALGGATLQFPNGTAITTNAASLSLDGNGAMIAGITGLAANSGSLSLTNGATFTTAGDFTNSGSVTVGPGSTLTVTGNYTQTAAATINVQIGGTPASGLFGQLVATGITTLAGGLQVALANGFTPFSGQTFNVLSFASAAGSFATVSGLAPFFTEAQTATNIFLAVGAAVSNTDLATTSVSDPATGLEDQTVTVNWTVENVGSATAAGSWHDAVYLAVSSVFTPNDLLLGEVAHTGGLAAGQNYRASAMVTLPGVLPGNYHFIVRTNALDEVAETTFANNAGASTATIAMDLPALNLGTPLNGQLARTGAAEFYKLTARAGSDLNVQLTGPAGATNELYLAFGDLPSRQSFAVRGIQPNSANQSVSLANTQAGTYYVLVYGANVASAETFTLTASTAAFAITSVSPSQGSDTGQVTVTIEGHQFDVNSRPQLIDRASATIAPTHVYYLNPGQIEATFDLTGHPAGAATVEVVNTGGATATLPGGFTIVAGAPGQLASSITAPSGVRVGRVFTVTVNYQNTGGSDLLAPIITVRANGPAQLSFTTDFSGAASSLELIAINPNGPAGILPAGASGSLTLYGMATAGGSITFQATPEQFPSTPIDYAAVEAQMKPPGLTDAQFAPLFAQLQTQIGTSWSGYVAALSRDATLLSPPMGINYSVEDVFALAAEKARAALNIGVTGRLFLRDNAHPLSGVPVILTGRTTGQVFTATSFTDGTFLFYTVAAETYDVSVEDYLLPAPMTLTAGSAHVTGLNLVVTPAGSIGGRVVESDGGAPLPNVLVTAVDVNGNPFTATTDSNGAYEISGLTPGVYSVQAGGGATVHEVVKGITVAAGPTNDVNLVLPASGTVTGTVTDAGGMPLAGVQITAFGPDGIAVGDAAATDNTGAYILSGLPTGVLTIQASISNLPTVQQNGVTVTAGVTSAGVNFTMQTGGSLQGTVTSLLGGAVVANVVLTAEIGGQAVDTQQSAADGTYTFPELPAGSYTITAALPGFQVATFTTTITAGQATTLGLSLAPAGTISGTVKRALDSAVLPGTYVTVTSNGSQIATVPVDTAGNYSVFELPYGAYVVTAGARGSSGLAAASATLSAAAPAATQNFSLSVVGSVSGTVFAADGTTPENGAGVALLQGGMLLATTFTDASGQYHYDIAAAGTYEVRAQASGTAFAPRTGIVVASGSDVSGINLTAGTAVVRGTVTSVATNQPVANAQITVTGDGMISPDLVFSDAAGNYQYSGPAGANLQLTASAGGLAFMQQSVTLAQSGPVTANFTLGAAAILSGTVAGPDSGPVAGAKIAVNGPNGAAAVAISDAQGNYRLDMLAPGTYDIAVTARGLQTLIVTSVSISGSLMRSFSLNSSSTLVQGTVTDGSNRPLAGAIIQATDSRGNYAASAISGADGTYTITTLPAGNFPLKSLISGAAVAQLTVTVANGANVSGQNFQLDPTVFAAAAPAPAPQLQPLAIGTLLNGFFGNQFGGPAKRLPDEATLPPPPTFPTCASVVLAYSEAKARVRNQNLLFDAWNDGYGAGQDLKSANAKLLVTESVVVVADINKIAAKIALLESPPYAAMAPGLALLQGDEANGIYGINSMVSLINTYIVNGKSLIESLSSSISGGIDLKSQMFTDILTQVFSLLGAARDLAMRIVDSKSAFGKASPYLDILLDIAGAVLDAYNTFNDFKQAAQDFTTVGDQTNSAKNLYIQAVVKAGFAVDRYNWELKNCQAGDPMVNGPGEVPLPPSQGGSSTTTNAGSAHDPNNLTGPAGFGPQGFIQPGTFTYEVDFENDPAHATAAAQVVTVTNTLDPNFDLSTFQFTGFGFGSHGFTVPAGLSHYQTTIDLRPNGANLLVPVTLDLNMQTRVVTVTFQSLDPLTLVAPNGLNDGFLPVDNANHDGEGFFTYTVQPKAGLPSGTAISNQASVVFDINSPILTPTTLNTLDVGNPTSTVAPLPAQETSSSFAVSWSGQDDAGGSGIASFDVFVSDNGGPFTPFQTGTTQTSAAFTGQVGHTYGFYSVATDNVGHRQPTPVAAQASTFVTASAQPGAISGTVFQDININGVQDAGEPGLPGQTVFLDLNASGTLDAGDPTAITDANGAYQFAALIPGAYTVQQELLGGVLLDAPASGALQVTVTSGANLTGQNFAEVPTSITVPLTLPLTTPFPKHGSANADYVEAIYRTVLNRDAEPAGLAFWTHLLDTGTASRLQVVQGIRTSPEHFTLEVTDFYFTLLGRAPDDAGLQFWVQALQSGLPEEQMAFDFLDSPEYLGKGDKFFIDHMYLSLLGRTFDSTGEQFWLNQLGDDSSGNATHPPTLTHEQIITDFLRSPESLTRLVQGYYQIFLQRLADPQGLTFWLMGLQQGQSFLTIGQDFLTSNEFYNNAAAEG